MSLSVIILIEIQVQKKERKNEQNKAKLRKDREKWRKKKEEEKTVSGGWCGTFSTVAGGWQDGWGDGCCGTLRGEEGSHAPQIITLPAKTAITRH